MCELMSRQLCWPLSSQYPTHKLYHVTKSCLYHQMDSDVLTSKMNTWWIQFVIVVFKYLSIMTEIDKPRPWSLRVCCWIHNCLLPFVNLVILFTSKILNKVLMNIFDRLPRGQARFIHTKLVAVVHWWFSRSASQYLFYLSVIRNGAEHLVVGSAQVSCARFYALMSLKLIGICMMKARGTLRDVAPERATLIQSWLMLLVLLRKK